MLLGLFALLAAAAPALAADERPCPDQIEALCPDTEPNTPQRRECVRKGVAKLSQECQRRLGHAPEKGARQSPIQPLLDACKPDQPKIKELCQDGGKLIGCLVEHRSRFSEGCQQMIGMYSGAPNK
jgi:hypothetical protein